MVETRGWSADIAKDRSGDISVCYIIVHIDYGRCNEKQTDIGPHFVIPLPPCGDRGIKLLSRYETGK